MMLKKEEMLGCWGDGANGHQHTRRMCAETLQYFANETDDIKAGWFVPCEALKCAMSDDAQEEYDACDWLEIHAPYEGAYWGWQDGDFGLWLPEED